MEGTIIAVILYLIIKLLEIYSGLLFVYALLTWLPGAENSVLGRFIQRICEPYLSLFDRLPLQLGMFSFRIFFGLIILQLASQGLFILIDWLV